MKKFKNYLDDYFCLLSKMNAIEMKVVFKLLMNKIIW